MVSRELAGHLLGERDEIDPLSLVGDVRQEEIDVLQRPERSFDPVAELVEVGLVVRPTTAAPLIGSGNPGNYR